MVLQSLLFPISFIFLSTIILQDTPWIMVSKSKQFQYGNYGMASMNRRQITLSTARITYVFTALTRITATRIEFLQKETKYSSVCATFKKNWVELQ